MTRPGTNPTLITNPTQPTETSASDVAPPVEVPPDSFAGELVNSGATPVEADPQDIMRRLQEQVDRQQKVIDRMAAERGISTNPRVAYLQTFLDHLSVQRNANPVHAADYDDLISLAKTMLDNPDDVTPDNAAYVLEGVDDLMALHPQHELAYTRQVVRDLRRFLLTPETESD